MLVQKFPPQKSDLARAAAVRAWFAVVAFGTAERNIKFSAVAAFTGFFGAVFVFNVAAAAASHAKNLSLTAPANSAGFSSATVAFWTFSHNKTPLKLLNFSQQFTAVFTFDAGAF